MPLARVADPDEARVVIDKLGRGPGDEDETREMVQRLAAAYDAGGDTAASAAILEER